MKAWDTNFLVRHLTEDNSDQLRVVRKELAKSERAGTFVWISSVVVVETAWVLKAYGLEKSEVLDVLTRLCEDARFQFEAGNDLTTAIDRCRKAGDLPEHLAALSAIRSKKAKTQTFDRAVSSFSEFEVFR